MFKINNLANSVLKAQHIAINRNKSILNKNELNEFSSILTSSQVPSTLATEYLSIGEADNKDKFVSALCSSHDSTDKYLRSHDSAVMSPLVVALFAIMDCLGVASNSLYSQSQVMTAGSHIAKQFNQAQQAFANLNSVIPFTWQDSEGQTHNISNFKELLNRYIGIKNGTDPDFNKLTDDAKAQLLAKFGHVAELYSLMGQQNSKDFPSDISLAKPLDDSVVSSAISGIIANLNQLADSIDSSELPSPITLNTGDTSQTSFNADSVGKLCDSLSKAITTAQNVNQQQSLLLQQDQTFINSWAQIGGSIISTIKESFQNAQAR